MHPRLKILSEINKLQDQHCEGCSYKNTSDYCRTECDISNQLKTLGKNLIENKAKDSRKPKSQSNIDIYFKDREVKTVEKKLTKEILFNLKGKGNSDIKIRKEYGLSNGKFYKLKNEFGMVGDNGCGRPKKVFESKAVVAKKELIVDGEVKELMSPKIFDIYRDNIQKFLGSESEDFEVIDDLKENLSVTEEALELARDKIRSLNNSLQMDNDFFVKTLAEKNAEIDVLTTRSKSVTTERDALNDKYIETLNNLEAMRGELNRIDKQPNKCDCPDKISKLEAKVMRLESNLAIEKHNNHDLINHINTIQIYKAKYYKTVEALKMHLPN